MDSEQGLPDASYFSPSSTSEEEAVRFPAQIDAAFDILQWAKSLEFVGRGGEGRDLNNKERSVYEAALEVLRLYLTGEMTFADRNREMPEEPKVENLASTDAKATR